MKKDFQGFRVRSENDDLSDTTVQSLCSCKYRQVTRLGYWSIIRTFIGSFLQLLVLCRFLDQIQDLRHNIRGCLGSESEALVLTWSLSSGVARGHALAREDGSAIVCFWCL